MCANAHFLRPKWQNKTQVTNLYFQNLLHSMDKRC